MALISLPAVNFPASQLTSGIVWNGPAMATPAQHQMMGIQQGYPNRISYKRKTKYHLAAFALPAGSMEKIDEPTGYYFPPDREAIIATMGKLNPVYNGRPQVWANIFLNAGNATRSRSKTAAFWYHFFYMRGLFYKFPPVPMRQATRFRLTVAGLDLMDHWAKERPRFAKFVDAYIDDKMRREIATDCTMLHIGTLPPSIDKLRAMFDKWHARATRHDMERERVKLQQQMDQLYAQQQQLYAVQNALNQGMGLYQSGLNQGLGAYTTGSFK